MKTPAAAALILAAGSSSRMGTPKALAMIGEETALEHAARRFREAGVEDVRVVVGYHAEQIIPVAQRLNVNWIYNESHAQGMLSSILKGVHGFEPGIDAFFLLPVDVPLVQPRTLRECLDAYRRSGAWVVYPGFQGRRGHPPVIRARLLEGLTADHEGGLRAFLKCHSPRSIELDVPDEGIVTSFNTPEEYRQLLAYADRASISTLSSR